MDNVNSQISWRNSVDELRRNNAIFKKKNTVSTVVKGLPGWSLILDRVTYTAPVPIPIGNYK